MDEGWITTEEAALILGVRRAYISDLIRLGRIIGEREPPADERSKVGRRVLISRESVEAYNDTRVRKPLRVPEDTSRPGNIPCPWCKRGAASYGDLELHLSIIHPRLIENREAYSSGSYVRQGKLSLAGIARGSGGDG